MIKIILFGLLLLVSLALTQEVTNTQAEEDVKEVIPDQEGEEFLLKALLFKKLLHGGGFGHARHFGGYRGGYRGGYGGGYGGGYYGGYRPAYYGGYRPGYFGGFGAFRG